MDKQQADAAAEAVMLQAKREQEPESARAERPSGKQTWLAVGLGLMGFGVGVGIGAGSDNGLSFGIVGLVLGMLLGTFAAGRRNR